jgi:hypothetical protein
MAVIRDSVKATIMMNHIKSWQQSGITQVEYCRRHQIKVKTLEYWLRKSRKANALQFVSVPLLPETPVRRACNGFESSGLAVNLGGIAQLEIGKNFDADTLVRFMRIVANL